MKFGPTLLHMCQRWLIPPVSNGGNEEIDKKIESGSF